MRLVTCLCCALLGLQLPAQTSPKQPLIIHAKLAPEFSGVVSGRLLVFIGPGADGKEVDTNPFQATLALLAGQPSQVYVAAKEVQGWAPGTIIDIDVNDMVFPKPLVDASPGDYQLQAVLDVAHRYNYAGRSAEDPLSDVVTLKDWGPVKGIPQTITLLQQTPVRAKESPPVEHKEAIHELSFPSPALVNFWGREILMRGCVLTPPSYQTKAKQRYPTVYYTHGFGGGLKYFGPVAADLYKRMEKQQMPEMIWVLLDESSATGTHEFADSVNNGPWGTALTTELIPYLERIYRMDGKARGRFLQGHSSGGWATLWLQTRYPKTFGGTWSTSPDPSDFHDFTGVDLYATHANIYHRPDGSPYPLVRDKGKVIGTMEQFVKLEQVLGDYGGQFASSEWVFSPRGPDGRPVQMFNRATGDVDPSVVAYWKDHYDIANLVQRQWKTVGPQLRGKIHLIVGAADTFYLDGAAHKLQAVLDSLNADAKFTFLPDRTHFNVYKVGDDRYGLLDEIAKEMYAVARPNAGTNKR